MATTTNTTDLANVRLRLRSDLRFSEWREGAEAAVVIEDGARSKFFRVGEAEFHFLRRLDGRTTVREAIGSTADQFGNEAINEHEAAVICKWAVDQQLASTAMLAPGTFASQRDEATGDQRNQQGNIFYRRIPLLYPNAWLSRFDRAAHFLAGPMFFLLWCAALCSAGLMLLNRLPEVMSQSSSLFTPQTWLVLAIVGGVLKVWHELCHALVCRRFGGEVREAGVTMILFIPFPYVDVTSAWRFKSKWQRMFVSAAGVYGELLIASAAVVVWSQAVDPVVRQWAFATMTMASLVTIVFNANPLMRFDGYFLFSDWLGIPNLQEKGRQRVGEIWSRIFWGRNSLVSEPWTQRDVLLVAYGVAAFLWQFLVTATIIMSAAAWWSGAGLLVSAVAVALWLLVPSFRLAMRVQHEQRMRSGVSQRLVRAAAMAGIAVVSCQLIPWPFSRSAPAVAVLPPEATVRAKTPGFVTKILVAPGDCVSQGQPLLELENRRLAAEIEELETLVRDAQVRRDQAQQVGKLADVTACDERLAYLKSRLEVREQQQSELTIRAPRTGTILDSDLNRLLDSYLASGAPALVIAEQNELRLRLSVAQEDAEQFANFVTKEVLVQPAGFARKSVRGTLAQIEPRGSNELRHAAMATTAGGPLPVKTTSPKESSDAKSSGPSVLLVGSRLEAEVVPIDDAWSQFQPGQTATVYLAEYDESILEHAWRMFSTKFHQFRSSESAGNGSTHSARES